jgi:hypothetical protein
MEQKLLLVIGGELVHVQGTIFKDPDNLDVVGVFSDPAQARAAWKAKAQQTVDNAHMRYFVLPLVLPIPEWQLLGYESPEDMAQHQSKFIKTE